MTLPIDRAHNKRRNSMRSVAVAAFVLLAMAAATEQKASAGTTDPMDHVQVLNTPIGFAFKPEVISAFNGGVGDVSQDTVYCTSNDGVLTEYTGFTSIPSNFIDTGLSLDCGTYFPGGIGLLSGSAIYVGNISGSTWEEDHIIDLTSLSGTPHSLSYGNGLWHIATSSGIYQAGNDGVWQVAAIAPLV